MQRFCFTFCLVLFGFSSLSHAQLTHIFNQTAHTNDGGYAQGVTVAINGTVFLANGDDGLRAYSYNDTSFINTAHIDNSNSLGGVDVVVAPDSTVFLANWEDGLWAYRYDGASFTNTAHIDDGGDDARARCVAIASEGMVFLANGGDGLRAYSYDGSSFTNTAHINDPGTARGVVVASDGTIFLANGADGLRAYSYDSSSFTNTAHIVDSSDSFWPGALDVAVASDSTVFLANGVDGLRVYSYNGNSFTNTAHINDPGTAKGVAVASDSTVFLANGGLIGGDDWGLWSYRYDGTSLINTAHINDDGDEYDVAVASDGTVFLASGGGGLFAYNYELATSVDNKSSNIPGNYTLEQNYPNPFNPTTIINYDVPSIGNVQLKIYNQLGQEIGTLVNSMQQIGSHQVVWDGIDNQGNVVSSGVYFYQLQAGSFVQTRKMLFIR